MEKQYFVNLCGEHNADYPYNVFGKSIINKRVYIHDRHINKGSSQDIKVGDIVMLSVNDDILAYGTAITDTTKLQKEDAEGWNYYVKVEGWIVGSPINKYGIKWATHNSRDVVKLVDKEYALDKISALKESLNPLL